MLDENQLINDLKIRIHQIDLLRDVAANILSFKDYMTFNAWHSQTKEKIESDLKNFKQGDSNEY